MGSFPTALPLARCRPRQRTCWMTRSTTRSTSTCLPTARRTSRPRCAASRATRCGCSCRRRRAITTRPSASCPVTCHLAMWWSSMCRPRCPRRCRPTVGRTSYISPLGCRVGSGSSSCGRRPGSAPSPSSSTHRATCRSRVAAWRACSRRSAAGSGCGSPPCRWTGRCSRGWLGGDSRSATPMPAARGRCRRTRTCTARNLAARSYRARGARSRPTC
jgi:hypothetical protein